MAAQLPTANLLAVAAPSQEEIFAPAVLLDLPSFRATVYPKLAPFLTANLVRQAQSAYNAYLLSTW